MFRLSARLGLEVLDARNAPSHIGGNDVATTDWLPEPESGTTWLDYQEYADAKNQKPRIVNFTVTALPGGTLRYSGTVVDEAPGGLTVTLTGVQACLQPGGETVLTDANGNFVFDGTAAVGDSGLAFANVSDAQGQAAVTVSYYLYL